MQKNVGTIDALMRITCGLSGLAWATSRMVRHPRRGMPAAMALMCAMRVAEGVTRFCPILKLMGTNTLDKKTTNEDENKIPSINTAHPGRS